MKFSNPADFRRWPGKAITLLAMSGVGKTTLANRLPKDSWFHYSGDYRIGTKYLQEPILDNIKRYVMREPYLAELLRNDSIYIGSNLTVENLQLLSSFLGKLGDPTRGGLALTEFKRRQHLHRQAEISAMNDVNTFIHKSRDIYGYRHFINDAGGSLCELDDPNLLNRLGESTVFVYIRSDTALEETLKARARRHPKPLYYQESFLDQQLATFMANEGLSRVEDMDPDRFVTWVFPQLVNHRLPRYQALADRYGYTVDYQDAERVRDDNDFIELICQAIEKDCRSPSTTHL